MVTVLAREDTEVYLHALQTMTEHFQLFKWGHCHFSKLHHCLEMSGSWELPNLYMYSLAVIRP
jgi:hypothetical protein